jgi:hypothetical protein
MAFVVAESGIGKSRLVQALYQQLTIDSAWDPPEVNYWPDTFNDQGVQLRVVSGAIAHDHQGRRSILGRPCFSCDLRGVLVLWVLRSSAECAGRGWRRLDLRLGNRIHRHERCAD